MANVKFYLDRRPLKTLSKHRVYLVFRYHNKRFSYYPPISIDPQEWNDHTARAKKTCADAKHINTILDGLENRLTEIKNNMELNFMLNGGTRPNIKEIKKAFFESIRPKQTRKPKASQSEDSPTSKKKSTKSKLSISILFNNFLREKAYTHTEGTLKIFRRVREHLEHFAEKTGASLEVSNIDVKFQRAYVNFLIEEYQHANATIGTEIRKIHAVLNHFSEEHSNTSFRKFKAPSYESKRFICSYDEILALLKYEPSETTLLRVRDCAVFSFFTGLSYTDLKNLRVSNLLDHTLNGEKIKVLDFKRQKTKKYNQIPLNKICIEILEKWKGKQASGQLLPVYGSDVVMNRYLHQLLKESGLFDQEVQKVKESGKRRIETNLPRWKAITFHSFRHGYASYLASQDVNPLTIQKLMGHSDMKTTMIYIQQNKKAIFTEALDKLEK